MPKRTFIYKSRHITSMGIAKVTRNYQVTLPKDIRNVKGIEIGDTILFAIDGDKVDVVKVGEEDLIKKVAGSWKNVKESSVDYINKMREEWGEREKRLGL